jgi:hypothetical protein
MRDDTNANDRPATGPAPGPKNGGAQGQPISPAEVPDVEDMPPVAPRGVSSGLPVTDEEFAKLKRDAEQAKPMPTRRAQEDP